MIKRMQVLLSMLMVSVLFLQNASVAHAAEGVFTESGQGYTYDSLPDDVPILYVDGRAIYKADITEDFMIISNPTRANECSYYYESNLAFNYQDKCVTANGHLSAFRYHQYDEWLYLDEDNAIQLARALEGKSSTWNNASQLLGLLEHTSIPGLSATGVFIGLVCGIVASSNEALADAIREYTDFHQPCIVQSFSNNYGNFWTVTSWDGQKCIRYGRTLSDGSQIPGGVIGSGVPSVSYVDSVVGYDGSTDIWY